MDWEKLATACAAILTAIVAWFVKRMDSRVSSLEKDRVTRDDFDELRTSMMSTFTNGHNRLEERLDRILERLADRSER